MPSRYTLTHALVAASIGSGVMCLAESGIGRTYRVFARRPGAEFNRRIAPRAGSLGLPPGGKGLGLAIVRADLPSGAAHVVEPIAGPALVQVAIMGPLEQRAGYHDICGGWSDGHDAVCERLCAAFAEGDVFLCVDSPGGAHAGLQQNIEMAMKAKAQHGRRVTGWADEQIGSAAAWWTFALCDELFVPVAGQVGSLGARAEHRSIAGAMEKAGETCTYFTWPGPGKVAFAPELPLGDEAKRRGERDVAVAGEAFADAVAQSAIGQRYGLTRDYIASLNADMLTGQQAVDAGLADGVATEDEVIEYALKLAQAGATKGAQTRATVRQSARGETMRKKAQGSQAAAGGPDAAAAEERAEEEDLATQAEGDEDPPPSSQPMPGKEPSAACAACGMQNETDAKFCDQCGASMAAKAIDDGGEEPPTERQQPPPPKRMNATAGLAEILGLQEGASVPAQKTAAIDLRQVFDYASSLTGQHDPGAVLGALSVMAEDAAASARLRSERDKIRRQQNTAERTRLAHRLVAAGVARGDVFRDVVSDAGERVGIKLTPPYAEMRLSTLRGVVEQKEKSAPRRNPFEPNRAAAETASTAAKTGAANKEARVKAAMSNPLVMEWANRPGQTLTLERLALSFVESNFDLPNGAPQ